MEELAQKAESGDAEPYKDKLEELGRQLDEKTLSYHPTISPVGHRKDTFSF